MIAQDKSTSPGGSAALAHGQVGHGDANGQVSQQYWGHGDWSARDSNQVLHQAPPDTVTLLFLLATGGSSQGILNRVRTTLAVT